MSVELEEMDKKFKANKETSHPNNVSGTRTIYLKIHKNLTTWIAEGRVVDGDFESVPKGQLL